MERYILTYIITLLIFLLAFLNFINYCNYNSFPKKSREIYTRNYYIALLLIGMMSCIPNVTKAWTTIILFVFVFLYLTYDIPFKMILLNGMTFTVLYCTFYICIYMLISRINALITQSVITDYILYDHNITHVIISTLLYVVYTLIFCTRLLHKNHIHNPYKKYMNMLLSMIFLLFGSYSIYALPHNTKDEMEFSIIVMFLTSIIVTVLILSFYNRIIHSLEEVTLDHLKFQRYEIAQNYYDEMLVKSRQLNALRHDFKNHLGIIQSRLEQENFGGAIDYLISLTVHTNAATDFVITNSTIISSILQSKKSVCDMKRIQFAYETLFDQIFNISDLELIIILGNILDNAIEATEKVLPKDKAIHLSINQINTYLVIQCTNPYVVKPQLNNGKLITTKEEKALHGIGLANVTEVCEKYGGELSFSFENEIFVINILLPNY